MFTAIWESIVQFGAVVKIWDLIDIAIVAFVIYKILHLINDTRAVQIIRGIAILFVILPLSEALHFNTISFIIKNTMQVGVLAVLIVFQPELRRALEQVGRSKLGKFMILNDQPTQSSNEETVSEMVKAVESMSQARVGALIVLERATKIGDIIRTGVPIDSVVTAELLVNIFVPNTPLHDGAVIIRDNRIKAAGCLLPLTRNEDLSSEIGTRHRAALGISEDSDAVVLVVSEETGKISLAINGNLTRNLMPTSLEKALLKFFENEDTPKTTRRKLMVWRSKAK